LRRCRPSWTRLRHASTAGTGRTKRFEDYAASLKTLCLEVNELHRAIGEFVVAFEQTCHAMQTCIIGILACAGLRDQQVVQIILAGVTAEPLRAMFESLIGERVQLNEVERGIIKNSVNRFQKLTEERNDIIHSTMVHRMGQRGNHGLLSSIGNEIS
jgi:hypothetical protein